LTLTLALPALSVAACVALSAQATPRMALPSQSQSAIQQIGCTLLVRGAPWAALGSALKKDVRVRLAVSTMALPGDTH
jgi:hypothetical protein